MKTKFYLLFIGLIVIGSLSLTSCEQEEEGTTTNIEIPHAEFIVNSWFYVANGETFTFSLGLDQTRSSQGIYIKHVEYYFDEEKVGESSVAPFELSYLIQNKSIGKHELKAKIELVGEGYSRTICTSTYFITILEKPFVFNWAANFDNEQHKNRIIHNGENLSGNIAIIETSLEAEITKVEFCWDDKTVDATSIEPFNFNYLLENETLGEHEFKIIVHVSFPQLDTNMTITRKQVMIVSQ